jgi:hypothetical protein
MEKYKTKVDNFHFEAVKDKLLWLATFKFCLLMALSCLHKTNVSKTLLHMQKEISFVNVYILFKIFILNTSRKW